MREAAAMMLPNPNFACGVRFFHANNEPDPRRPIAQPTAEYDLMLSCCSFHVRCAVLQVIGMSPSNDSEHSSIHYYVGIARGTLEALDYSSGQTIARLCN